MLALVVIVLDQVSKYLVIDHFEYAERLPIIPGFFDLTLLYNPGAAFSFLAGHDGWQRWFFALIAIVASGFFLYLLHTSRGRKVFSLSLGLILGGAIGNLIDRLLLGHVTDFLLFYQTGSWHFPAFNLADAAITLGAILMIGEELLPLLRRRKTA
ncbi:MAG: signal peptidase II [Lautropia sp.]|nr:signal peptidase II [Lautropia sp.]